MRPFESYAVYLSLYLLWHGSATGAAALTAALGVVVAAHLWIERPRWQLTLLYAHTAYLINAALLADTQTEGSATSGSGSGSAPASSWAFLLSSAAILMASAALACLFPVARFPPLQGRFKAIGVVQRFLATDFATERHARTKALWSLPVGVQDAQRHPLLAVSAFYPSALAPNPHEATRGLKFLSPAALNALAAFLSMPRALFSYVTLARIRAVPDLPIAPASASQSKLPIVLFSHGLGGTATMYSSQVCELASQGYVVFTLTHNDGSAALAELDNNVQVPHRTVPGVYGDPAVTAVRKEQVQTRVAELSLLLDAIIEAEETGEWPFPVPFAGRLDLTRVGLMGHSFGAATVTLMASKETRVKSVVAHDLWTLPLPESVLSGGIHGPPLLLTQSDEWTQWKANNEETTVLAQASRDARLVQVLGTRHSNYSDVPMFSQMLSRKMRAIGSIEFKEGMRRINAISMQFLQRHLTGKDTGTGAAPTSPTAAADGNASAPNSDAPMFERMLQQRQIVMLAQSKAKQ